MIPPPFVDPKITSAGEGGVPTFWGVWYPHIFVGSACTALGRSWQSVVAIEIIVSYNRVLAPYMHFQQLVRAECVRCPWLLA